MSDILDFDRQHLWHPYTSMIDPLPVYLVKSCSGVRINLEDGRSLIDGMSSWWSVIHGYNNPLLNQAMESQLEKMSHVMFGGLTHRPAIELAQKLLSMVPEGLEKVFYCDSGSVAVEVAVKMALQYQNARGCHNKNKLATIRGGYHGDTWHAMSVCDPVTGMHSIFSGRLPIQFFVDRPMCKFGDTWNDDDFAPMRNLIEQHNTEIGAVILEPVVQGAGGIYFYHPQYVKQLKELCDQYDIIFIADEIATGFGRTGKMFACQWAGVTPDIMTVGKAITGGYMSFAAVLATGSVAQVISEGDPSCFMHGPTFMGNPLACAVACASLDILINNSPLARIAEIQKIMSSKLSVAKGFKNVVDVRVLGAIGAIEMNREVDMAVLQREFVDHGIWIRPFGKVIYIMPPYIISDRDLDFLLTAMVDVVSKIK